VGLSKHASNRIHGPESSGRVLINARFERVSVALTGTVLAFKILHAIFFTNDYGIASQDKVDISNVVETFVDSLFDFSNSVDRIWA
jgi:hypothetical protein